MQFQNGSNEVVIELRVVQFWSEIILVISNRTRAARLFNFEITRMISAQIALSAITIINFQRLSKRKLKKVNIRSQHSIYCHFEFAILNSLFIFTFLFKCTAYFSSFFQFATVLSEILARILQKSIV